MTKEEALEEIYAMQDSISQLSKATGTNDYRLAMQALVECAQLVAKIDKL